MKCQKCGAGLPEGHLYCEHCGEEVQMVPDFEPELYNSLTDVLSGLAREVIEDKLNIPLGDNAESGKAPSKRKKKRKQKLGRLLLGLLGVTLVFFLFLLNSSGYRKKLAVLAFEKGQYGQAAEYYLRLKSRNPDEKEWYQKGAVCLLELGESKAAEELLSEGITALPEEPELYSSLLRLYEGQHRFQAISDLIKSCPIETVKQDFNSYVAWEPEFSCESGAYTRILELKLHAKNLGTIYYTLDGSSPTEDSVVYNMPLRLGKGEYHLRAVFVSETGAHSDITEAAYIIRVDTPLAPVVALESDTYEEPVTIEVVAEEGTTIYYTTDETEPTEKSRKYRRPIPMPLGESTFRFVAYTEDGVPGRITYRRYMLNIKTGISPEEAEGSLVQRQISEGVLLDRNGALPDKYGVYRYFYDFPTRIEENNYYIFSEHYLENEINDLTGRYFAVDVVSGDIYGAALEEDGSCTLK